MNILITGGASGLGEAITRILAKNKENAICFTYAHSQYSADTLTREFSNTKSVKCDFKDPESVTSLVDSIDKLSPDVLINNAFNGEFLKSHFHKTPPDEFLNDFTENIMPVIKITQAAIKTFRKKRKGKIITILTSALINVPPVGSSIYIANKAYLEQLSKVWATENIRFNISSNTISPSMMETRLTAGIDERVVSQITAAHPLGKLLGVAEAAAAVEFLVNASPHINGVDIPINAGNNIK